MVPANCALSSYLVAVTGQRPPRKHSAVPRVVYITEREKREVYGLHSRVLSTKLFVKRGEVLAAACVLGRWPYSWLPFPVHPNTTLSYPASHNVPLLQTEALREGCWWPPPHTSTHSFAPQTPHFPPTKTELYLPSRNLWRSLSEQPKTLPFDVIYGS